MRRRVLASGLGVAAVGVVAAQSAQALVIHTSESAFDAATAGLSLSVEDFEAFDPSPGSFQVISGALDAGDFTISNPFTDSVFVSTVPTFPLGGTTKIRWTHGIDEPFVVTFDEAVNAFAFDFVGFNARAAFPFNVMVTLDADGDGDLETLSALVDHPAGTPGFIGLVDLDRSFSEVIVNADAVFGDVYVVDRFQYGAESSSGSGPGPLPEPSTLATLGLSLGALGWMRRRRRRMNASGA